MNFSKLKTPVLLLVFKRPATTQKVFDVVRQARPAQLYIAANGPRKGNQEDHKKCQATRKIFDQVDWDCDVKTLYRKDCLNVKLSVSSAIDWFFSNVEEGIILEDDCVPDISFFQFCSEQLEKYRMDQRIMSIVGTNFSSIKGVKPYSYYFSRFHDIGGWASWRRAWEFYDIDMKLWPEIKKDKSLSVVLGEKAIIYWTSIFDRVYHSQIETWDYQWIFACWAHNGLCIVPHVNLITNIGFGIDATFTNDPDNILANVPLAKMEFPVKHPPCYIPDVNEEKIFQKVAFEVTFAERIRRKLKRVVKTFFF